MNNTIFHFNANDLDKMTLTQLRTLRIDIEVAKSKVECKIWGSIPLK